MPKIQNLVRVRDRAVALEEGRKLKMARSAHAYVRGNTWKFYEWLDTASSSALPQGPAIWICGDCHLSNIGPIASSDGEIEVQIRDLDQTVIGNPAHDLVRLGLSLASAARGSDLPGVTTAVMLEQMLKGYQASLAGSRSRRQARLPTPVHVVMRDALRRRWRHLAQERIAGEASTIPLGKRFWPLAKAERKAIAELVASDAMRQLLTGVRKRRDDAPVQMIDAAYWMKGCSSLGLLRYAALVRIGDASDSSLCLVDLKEAVTAAAPRYADVSMPRDNALRIVEGARHLSPHLGDRMLPARLMERAVFAREMFPQDLKIELDRLQRADASLVAHFLGGVVGQAHARQLDRNARNDWRDALKRNHSKTLDAPSWLWKSVVDLVSSHEAGYLEHCRRYALDQQRQVARADPVRQPKKGRREPPRS